MSQTNYYSGHQAEHYAANFLVNQGYKILALNWKTRYCEIDIIAIKNKVLYLIEVKSRSNAKQGSALEYITPAKLRKMTFAAELWVNTNDWGGDYQLSALAVDSGKITFVKDIV